MTTAMQQALLRRGCARLTQSLAECRDLPAGEVMLARLGMLAVLGLASRGPMLALPWREEQQPDRKMQAANDDTFKPH
jgi:hypothetical protein